MPSLQPITSRLLENQKEIGEASKSFVGEESGNELTRLLTQHILAASAVVKAAVAGDKKQLKPRITTLFENSTQVARLLGAVRPDVVSYDTFKQHFDQHNEYVIDITTQYIEKRYEKVIATYDCYYTHMLMFSDLVWAVLV